MGHLSRNLALAEAFSVNNYQCKFLIKTDDKNKVLSFVRSRQTTSMEVIFLSEEVGSDEDIVTIIEHYDIGNSFLVLDHYDHDMQYQKKLKNAGVLWAQYDYKKEDRILADIVINPNLNGNASDYTGLIGSDTQLCVGGRFAIISDTFKKNKTKQKPNRILIAMGGGNYPQAIKDMINALVSDSNYRFDVVTTNNTLKNRLKDKIHVEVHQNPENIAEIYARNYVAIVAGGVTTYELAYLNIPMIIVPFADNQQENAKKWQMLNYAITYSTPEIFVQNILASGLMEILLSLHNNYKNRTVIIDGEGAKRIVKTIESQLNG